MIAVVLLTGLLLPSALCAQAVRTVRIGGSESSWNAGGHGIDPVIVGGTLYKPVLDTTNTPDAAVDFRHRPGWIGPLFFDEEVNIVSRVLEEGSKITSPNSVEQKKVVRAQLAGIVNGNHEIAFERKPTVLTPMSPLGIWVILDFNTPIGINRVRFYPRNTLQATPNAPYHNDFLRGYELFINETQTSRQRSPDVLVARESANTEAIVDLPIPLQYTRLVKLKSLTTVPWEIDEFEVYATGYLQRATFVSDLIYLRNRATLGEIRWEEEAIGREIRSNASVRVRSGVDNTPLVFERRILDSLGVWLGETEVVQGAVYNRLERRERGLVHDDDDNWSPWKLAENGKLVTAPGPRRYVQFQIDLKGELFDTRQVHWLEMDFLQPPLGDTLRAEVFPRIVPAENRATFHYAVLLRALSTVRGFDRLEIDANARVENLRGFKVNGVPAPFRVDAITEEGFALSFSPVTRDSSIVEFSFDVPIFRFGTTFSGKAYDTASGDLPQLLEPGQVVDFDPGVDANGDGVIDRMEARALDLAELSSLSVAIPREQVGELLGEIVFNTRLITPNGDGINDELEVFFNLLQLTKPTPVIMQIFDLTGRRVAQVFAEERSIGPTLFTYGAVGSDGQLLRPGNYIWSLSVEADAFEERHVGVLGVAY